jgi:hypothetical protein
MTAEIPFKGKVHIPEPRKKERVYPDWNIKGLPEKGSPASNYRYATPAVTNDIVTWLATDGPASEAALEDLCTALLDRTMVGEYKAYDFEKEWEGNSKPRISVSGPRRSLILTPRDVGELVRELTRIKESGAYRKVPPKTRTLF